MHDIDKGDIEYNSFIVRYPVEFIELSMLPSFQKIFCANFSQVNVLTKCPIQKAFNFSVFQPILRLWKMHLFASYWLSNHAIHKLYICWESYCPIQSRAAACFRWTAIPMNSVAHLSIPTKHHCALPRMFIFNREYSTSAKSHNNSTPLRYTNFC